MTLVAVGLFAQRDSSERAAWNEPVKPFRIIGNVYYVGVSGVTSFLITTPQGHILLDGGFPETAPRIEKNIAARGFRIQDVKVLLNSHAITTIAAACLSSNVFPERKWWRAGRTPRCWNPAGA